MKSKKPLIGITPWYDYEKEMTYVKKGYCEGVNKAGGVAVLLPAVTDEELLSDIFKRCDGFLISGGPDIDPCNYGEYNMPFNGTISPYRDVMEIFLIKKAIEYNKSVLGICRGIQAINAALGGTLYQDISCQVKDRAVLKHFQDAPEWYPTHDISIARGSRIWSSFGMECLRVNSYHHQAVRDVAPGFTATSWAPDGIIESVEYADSAFTVGVQWHPEIMWQRDARFLKLFEEFVESCGSGT